jgi:acyl carrier protein
MSSTRPPVEREEFYGQFAEFLRELKPDGSLPDPDPDTHLWESGYLDSFAMLEVVVHLEEITEGEITLGPDALPSFFTLRRIYDTYLTGAAS